MLNKLTIALALAGVATTGITGPAAAQDYYGRDGYHQDYRQNDRYADDGRYDQDARYQNYREQEYQRYQAQRRAQDYRRYNGNESEVYYNGGRQGYVERGTYGQRRYYRQDQRCNSGTTGAVLGAVVGGLLGREVGRGGRYNAPSTTGLILGAGGGALAGRAIERSGNDCR